MTREVIEGGRHTAQCLYFRGFTTTDIHVIAIARGSRFNHSVDPSANEDSLRTSPGSTGSKMNIAATHRLSRRTGVGR